MKLAIPVNLTTASVMIASLVLVIFFTTKDSVPEDADIVIKMRDDERVIQTLEDLGKKVMTYPEGKTVKVALAGWHQVVVLPFLRMSEKPENELAVSSLYFGESEILFNDEIVNSKVKNKLDELMLMGEASGHKPIILIGFDEIPTPLESVSKKLKIIGKNEKRSGTFRLVTSETIPETQSEVKAARSSEAASSDPSENK